MCVTEVTCAEAGVPAGTHSVVRHPPRRSHTVRCGERDVHGVRHERAPGTSKGGRRRPSRATQAATRVTAETADLAPPPPPPPPLQLGPRPRTTPPQPYTVQTCPRRRARAVPRVCKTAPPARSSCAPQRAHQATIPLLLALEYGWSSVTLCARPRHAAAPHRHARGLWPRAAHAAPCEMAWGRDRRRIGRGDAPGGVSTPVEVGV